MLSSTSTKVTNVTFTQGDLFNALKSSFKEKRAKLMQRIMEDEEEDFKKANIQWLGPRPEMCTLAYRKMQFKFFLLSVPKV
jgi:hypothetical protein